MQTNLFKRDVLAAKPFLKCAGGKAQLLGEFQKRIPQSILHSLTIERYVEPFLGGGAMFFFLKNNFIVKESFLFDINQELIMGYNVVKNDPDLLINKLGNLEEIYLNKSDNERETFFYDIRKRYNEQMFDFDYEEYNSEWIKRASYLVFLNKTCFNGLFRQNKKGEFNVPFGKYKNPTICDKKNIIQVNKAIKDTKIINGDFSNSGEYINKKTFVYFDPPYRPISNTSSFTSYAKEGFDDEDQKRLSQFFKKMDDRGAYLMLSNSDPKNVDFNDEFFDILYKKYVIDRVPAKRSINCDASKRGEINEIIVRNYD
ncbi:MAG: modification methylase [Methanobacteriales archaeon Met13]